MSEVVPFPRSGDVVDDVRGEGRTLRVTTHDDSGLVVVSIWYGGTCAASAWLSRDDAARLVAALCPGPRRHGLAGPDNGEPIAWEAAET